MSKGKVIPLKETADDKAVRRAAMENSGKRLLEIIVGVEGIIEKEQALADEKKARFAAAKSDGCDTKAMRKVIKRRAMDEAAISAMHELDAVVDTYLAALAEADGGEE
jgi:uncharacterized protein (UPF0335 family)